MNTDSILIKFNIDDLNKFAPQGVVFLIDEMGMIRTSVPEYKNKYPEIDSFEGEVGRCDVFYTGFKLSDFEIKIGKFINLDGEKFSTGFINRLAEESFKKAFVNRGDNHNIIKHDIFSELDMKTQKSDFDRYGRLIQDHAKVVNSINKSEDLKNKKVKSKSKVNLFGIRNKSLKSDNDSISKLESLEKEENNLRIQILRIFYKFNFNPKGILAFALRKATIAKIQDILNQMTCLQSNNLQSASSITYFIVANYDMPQGVDFIKYDKWARYYFEAGFRTKNIAKKEPGVKNVLETVGTSRQR